MLAFLQLVGGLAKWVVIGLFVYFVWRVFRPKTTREILGRPAPFVQRLQPTVIAYEVAEEEAIRAELREDLISSFRDGLRQHDLSVEDFDVEIVEDDLGAKVASVRRRSDGHTWSLQEFDDFIFVEKPEASPRAS